MNSIRLSRNARNILNTIVARGPSTEKQIIDEVRPPYMSQRWGNSYFLIAGGNGNASSLLKRGLITCIGRGKHGARIYAITNLGLTALKA